jgi:DNA polymerase III epsilon subunit-like protein
VLLWVIDIETTGMAPPAEIIEFGRVDVVSEGDAWRIGRPMVRLYRPLNGIPPETMAVHHITEADFPPTLDATAERELSRTQVRSLAPPRHPVLFLAVPLRQHEFS